jgi:hypothetical protein
MRTKMLTIALALGALPATAGADTRIAALCGQGHVNEAASATDVRASDDGFFVASLSERVSLDDPRIIMTAGDDFHLCTRSDATPDMDATKAALLMRERTVKYLFVPSAPQGAMPPS